MKSAPKFTPGPWRFDKINGTRRVLVGSRGGRITYVDDDIGTATEALIAAAPELYEACRSICGVFEGREDAPIYVLKARAALAKVQP